MSLTASLSSVLTSNGQDDNFFPMLSELTVTHAAKFLRSSEGYVTELLDDGLIEYRQEEGQRFVQWNSLADFEQERERGYQALERIVQWSQELGLYDD
jgi:hypothetical protein